MDEKQMLIAQLDQAHATMQKILDKIELNREIYPPWTFKEILAHIIGWDEVSELALRAHAKGEEAGTPAARGIDHYNVQSVSTRESLNYDQIVKEWILAREQFKQAILELPDEKLSEPMLFPWGQTGTPAQIVGIMVHHEIEHAEEIANLIEDV
ncbi:MAG: DinB family protein [Anaerolineales bacterium]|nr:DinB family protein [Anaerolineales bacterium]